MFKLKEKQLGLGFLLLQSQHLHQHLQLSSAAMASFIARDPSIYFKSQCRADLFPYANSSESKSKTKYNGCSMLFPFAQKVNHPNCSSGVNFRIRCCADANINSNRHSIHQKPTTRASVSPPHPPLFAEMENICLSDAAVVKEDIEEKLNGIPRRYLGSQKVTVAVDVDEVLGNFISALNRFIADHYSSNYSLAEYHVYEFFKIWNCSRDEADIRVHEFFKTSYFTSGIHPIPGAQTALWRLSRFCNLSVVTSRQNAIKAHTLEWIEKYYQGLFKEIHFGNHFALDGESRPKSEICRSLGAKVLIDDNPSYARECAEVGIRVLLFDYENSYPWSKNGSVDQHPLVTKVHNWEEVEQKLTSYHSDGI